MMHPTKSTAILALALLAAGADAHGKMTLPEPTCSAGYCSNSPSGTIDGPSTIPVPAGMSYGTDPQSNTDAFLKAFKTSKYKTLKDLVTSSAVKLESGASLECGYSSVTGKAQPLPATVQWDKFDLSHMGPCEVWCDNTRVFQDDQCSVNFKTQPAVLSYDKAKCAGAKMLTSYWIALHVPTWQVYTNCAPLSGGGASSGGATTGGANSGGAAAGGNNDASKSTISSDDTSSGTNNSNGGNSSDDNGGNSGTSNNGSKSGNSNNGGNNNNKPTTNKPNSNNNNNNNNNKPNNKAATNNNGGANNNNSGGANTSGNVKPNNNNKPTNNNNSGGNNKPNNNNRSTGNAPAKPAGNVNGNNWTVGK